MLIVLHAIHTFERKIFFGVVNFVVFSVMERVEHIPLGNTASINNDYGSEAPNYTHNRYSRTQQSYWSSHHYRPKYNFTSRPKLLNNCVATPPKIIKYDTLPIL